MRHFLSVIIFLLSSFTLASQSWVDLRQQNKSFFEVKAAFDAEWSNKEYEKGHGYKQFKRWEYFVKPRVNDEGFLPPSSQVREEFLKFKKNKKSTNKNGNWSFSGAYDINDPGGEGIGRVSVVAVDPIDASTIYVGTPAGGLWKSTDNGNNWTPKTDHLMAVGVTGIAIDYTNSDIIYIGTGDGDASDTYSIGVLKSIDGGDTWQTTGLVYEAADLRTVHRLIMHPTNPQILFVATSQGLWKTENAGANWFAVSTGEVEDVEFHPTNPDVMYLCKSEFYKSTDGGDSFFAANDGLPSGSVTSRLSIAVSPDEPDWVYLLAGSNDFGLQGVYRSTNAGESFSQRADDSPNLMGWSSDGSGDGGQAWYDMALAVDPTNANRIFVGGVNVWRSNNGGSTWALKANWTSNSSSNYVHADVHFLEYFGSKLYCGSDGGIFKSSSDGNSWSNTSAGLAITQVYSIGTTDQNTSLVTMGAQDNGTSMTTGGTWNRVFGADGMETHIHPGNQNRIYVATQNGGLYVSSNGGSSFNNFSWGVNETGAWLTPYELKPSNPNAVIVGFENVWQFNDNGTWSQLSDFHFLSITHVALSQSNSEYIYFSRDHKMYRTSNFGDDWTDVSEGLPGGDITGIEVDVNNPDVVYVSLSGYEEGEKVFRTFDGGETWENYSFNLPNVPANCLALGSNGGVYVGTDFGVFYIDENLSNWQYFNDNLPVVPVVDLDLLSNSNLLKAATYGRGVWQTPLYTPLSEAPIVDFESNTNVICEGQSILFTDFSFNATPNWNWTFEGGEPSSSSESMPVIVYEGPGTFAVTLSMSNAFGEDEEIKTGYITVLNGSADSAPYSEGFEDYSELPENVWFLNNPGGNITWELNEEVGFLSGKSISIDNNQGSINDIDELISKPFNLTDGVETELVFKYAHAQRNDDNHGKLKLYFSANCGDNWQLQGTNTAGSSLHTTEPTTNYFIPSDDEWSDDSENINSQYLGPNFRFKFQYRNDGGNVLYLDDINILGYIGINELDWMAGNISVYPNPTSGIVTVSYEQKGETELEIYNLLGEVVYSELLPITYGDQKIDVDVSHLSNGVYQIKMVNEDEIQTARFMVKK